MIPPIWAQLYISEAEWRSYTPIKRWQLKNPEKNKAANKAWRQKNLEYDYTRQRIRTLRVKYNLTLEQYDALLLSQNYSCKLCGSTKVGGHTETFHIDHCHTTGKVRGLLCTNCNRGLGLLGDTLASIERAYLYMKESTT